MTNIYKTFLESDEEKAEKAGKFGKLSKSTFDQKPLVPFAIKWLEKKFPNEEFGFTFKHVPKLANPTKTYQCGEGSQNFDIAGRLHDSNSDGKADTVLFKILPVEEDEEEIETF